MQESTVDKLAVDLLKDRVFYDGGGGVTYTGGEPLLQADKLECLWSIMSMHGVHQAAETSLCVGDEAIEAAASSLDLLIIDFKPALYGLDGTMGDLASFYNHRVSILKKFRPRVWVRAVLVDGLITDEFLSMLDGYAAALHAEKVERLPMHNLGFVKARRIREEPR